VLGEIEQLNGEVERAGNALYSANQRLGRIESDLRTNTQHLAIAKKGLVRAQNRAAARLRGLYLHGNGGGTVEILLGAESLNDLLDRLDTARRVSRQDAKVLGDVRDFRREVGLRQVRLTKARAEQASLVAQRAADKRSIESKLAQQQSLLSSIKDEIAKLQAAERARQARLAAEARARLLQQQHEQREAAAAAALAASYPSGTLSTDSGVIPADVPPPSHGNVVGIALQYLGTPYVWGASGPGAFDCSGFTMYIYAQVGVSLPHNAAAQFGYGVPVDRSQLQPGDLVFFDGLGHVGLYIGGGQFVHAPHTGDVVKISSLYESWYASTWVGARRIV
jgi:peptidoglycan DL-endopeptidase CwlO